MKAKVLVKLKEGVLDPQGQAIQQLLEQRGYRQIIDVRVGKLVEFELENVTLVEGEALLAEISDKLLANPVIETFRIETL